MGIYETLFEKNTVCSDLGPDGHGRFIRAFAQNVTVTGTVKDAATNELLVGATVMVKGTTNGVSTDINGYYSIKAKAEDVLVCSIIGYKSVESKVGSKAVVDYALQPDNQLLDATVVVGYGTLKRLSSWVLWRTSTAAS